MEDLCWGSIRSFPKDIFLFFRSLIENSIILTYPSGREEFYLEMPFSSVELTSQPPDPGHERKYWWVTRARASRQIRVAADSTVNPRLPNTPACRSTKMEEREGGDDGTTKRGREGCRSA